MAGQRRQLCDRLEALYGLLTRSFGYKVLFWIVIYFTTKWLLVATFGHWAMESQGVDEGTVQIGSALAAIVTTMALWVFLIQMLIRCRAAHGASDEGSDDAA